MNKRWKQSEIDFVKNNASLMKDSEIAIKLTKITGRRITVDAVRKKRQLLGIKKEHGRGICQVVGQKKESSSVGKVVRQSNG